MLVTFAVHAQPINVFEPDAAELQELGETIRFFLVANPEGRVEISHGTYADHERRVSRAERAKEAREYKSKLAAQGWLFNINPISKPARVCAYHPKLKLINTGTGDDTDAAIKDAMKVFGL